MEKYNRIEQKEIKQNLAEQGEIEREKDIG
jgi:hypothetical protein